MTTVMPPGRGRGNAAGVAASAAKRAPAPVAKTVKNPAGDGLVGRTTPGKKPLNVQALRTALVNHGYDIPKTGAKMGNLMKAALRDYLHPDQQHPIGGQLASALGPGTITGKRDPQSWNQRYGSPATKSVVSTPHLNQNGNLIPVENGQVTGDPSAPDASGLVNQMLGLNPNVGKAISEKLAQGGAKLFDPKQADSIAGLQFDPQIRQSGIDAVNAGIDNKQAVHDIGHWYDQVLGAEDTARGRDTAATASGQASLTDSVSKIIASLGGSANGASGSVGSSGATALGTLGAVGAAQDMYNSDIRPLLRDESAGARTRQTVLGADAQKTYAATIAGLRGQRGQAEANAAYKIQGDNNAILDDRNKTLLGIKSGNNQLAQQGLGNKISLLTTQAGLIAAGAKTAASVKDWAHGTATDKKNWIKGAIGTVLGPGGNPTMPVGQALQQIQASLANQGITDPAAVQLAVSALRASHPKWFARAQGGS